MVNPLSRPLPTDSAGPTSVRHLRNFDIILDNIQTPPRYSQTCTFGDCVCPFSESRCGARSGRCNTGVTFDTKRL